MDSGSFSSTLRLMAARQDVQESILRGGWNSNVAAPQTLFRQVEHPVTARSHSAVRQREAGQLSQAEEIRSLRLEIHSLCQKLEEHRSEKLNRERDIEALVSSGDQMAAGMRRLAEENERLTHKVDDLQHRLEQAHATLRESEVKRKVTEERLAVIPVVEKLETRVHELESELNRSTVRLRELKQGQQTAMEERDFMEQRARRLEEIQRQFEDSEARAAFLQRSVDTHRQTISQLKEELNAVRQETSEQRALAAHKSEECSAIQVQHNHALGLSRSQQELVELSATRIRNLELGLADQLASARKREQLVSEMDQQMQVLRRENTQLLSRVGILQNAHEEWIARYSQLENFLAERETEFQNVQAAGQAQVAELQRQNSELRSLVLSGLHTQDRSAATLRTLLSGEPQRFEPTISTPEVPEMPPPVHLLSQPSLSTASLEILRRQETRQSSISPRLSLDARTQRPGGSVVADVRVLRQTGRASPLSYSLGSLGDISAVRTLQPLRGYSPRFPIPPATEEIRSDVKPHATTENTQPVTQGKTEGPGDEADKLPEQSGAPGASVVEQSPPAGVVYEDRSRAAEREARETPADSAPLSGQAELPAPQVEGRGEPVATQPPDETVQHQKPAHESEATVAVAMEAVSVPGKPEPLTPGELPQVPAEEAEKAEPVAESSPSVELPPSQEEGTAPGAALRSTEAPSPEPTVAAEAPATEAVESQLPVPEPDAAPSAESQQETEAAREIPAGSPPEPSHEHAPLEAPPVTEEDRAKESATAAVTESQSQEAGPTEPTTSSVLEPTVVPPQEQEQTVEDEGTPHSSAPVDATPVIQPAEPEAPTRSAEPEPEGDRAAPQEVPEVPVEAAPVEAQPADEPAEPATRQADAEQQSESTGAPDAKADDQPPAVEPAAPAPEEGEPPAASHPDAQASPTPTAGELASGAPAPAIPEQETTTTTAEPAQTLSHAQPSAQFVPVSRLESPEKASQFDLATEGSTDHSDIDSQTGPLSRNASQRSERDRSEPAPAEAPVVAPTPEPEPELAAPQPTPLLSPSAEVQQPVGESDTGAPPGTPQEEKVEPQESAAMPSSDDTFPAVEANEAQSEAAVVSPSGPDVKQDSADQESAPTALQHEGSTSQEESVPQGVVEEQASAPAESSTENASSSTTGAETPAERPVVSEEGDQPKSEGKGPEPEATSGSPKSSEDMQTKETEEQREPSKPAEVAEPPKEPAEEDIAPAEQQPAPAPEVSGTSPSPAAEAEAEVVVGPPAEPPQAAEQSTEPASADSSKERSAPQDTQPQPEHTGVQEVQAPTEQPPTEATEVAESSPVANVDAAEQPTASESVPGQETVTSQDAEPTAPVSTDPDATSEPPQTVPSQADTATPAVMVAEAQEDTATPEVPAEANPPEEASATEVPSAVAPAAATETEPVISADPTPPVALAEEQPHLPQQSQEPEQVSHQEAPAAAETLAPAETEATETPALEPPAAQTATTTIVDAAAETAQLAQPESAPAQLTPEGVGEEPQQDQPPAPAVAPEPTPAAPQQPPQGEDTPAPAPPPAAEEQPPQPQEAAEEQALVTAADAPPTKDDTPAAPTQDEGQTPPEVPPAGETPPTDAKEEQPAEAPQPLELPAAGGVQEEAPLPEAAAEAPADAKEDSPLPQAAGVDELPQVEDQKQGTDAPPELTPEG
eukprot:TRINITY_DN9974_c0_g1_i1.p1 TRINITY_DN9974_c0_g1~~TRINITY_DN9974_c0_g1_i1.p1  ORF type:complete len:1677 (+),score=278.25 TRINITY_DN9974_c0_g1_i1:60-5090(+)